MKMEVKVPTRVLGVGTHSILEFIARGDAASIMISVTSSTSFFKDVGSRSVLQWISSLYITLNSVYLLDQGSNTHILLIGK